MVKLSKMEQRIFYFFISHRSRTLSCHDHNIQTTIEYRFMQPITFPHQPCNPVSYNTVADLFTHTDSYSVFLRTIFLDIHNQILIRIRLSVLIHKLELVIFF